MSSATPHTPGHHTPGHHTPGQETPGHHTPGHHTPGQETPGHHHPVEENPWATGGAMFAGVLMLVNGVLGVFVGIAGIAKDDVYERVGDYVYKFNLTTWGWIHLVLGLVIAVTGWGILKGAAWAKATGVALAALGVVAQFLWLPYTPVWAFISIALGVFVIWALCTDRSDVAGP